MLQKSVSVGKMNVESEQGAGSVVPHWRGDGTEVAPALQDLGSVSSATCLILVLNWGFLMCWDWCFLQCFASAAAAMFMAPESSGMCQGQAGGPEQTRRAQQWLEKLLLFYQDMFSPGRP